ncbi:LysR substrate-binding domain-containing protein [Erwinia sorbitola]|uniref:LysR family transcriptional regulator n=1 Tax=Erwinia sorbitola TaxID=2681984 RepID=A0A6I6ELC2_9GAMM|nr:LysR substrate-binding domain-containing protein [Erwinia sorbitola]MTD27366.1 LysR family transcriptional regulator [Erwinia sorbitola]QGU88905.1 LysR family transcriptional regulator [Erwinia sorbitola]
MQPFKRMTFDLDALRTFVIGTELGSFTQAADRLNRSTSAVSAQLKKLEQQTGLQLLQKSGRRLILTDSGELLMAYGRRLLALNDEAFSALSGRDIAGRVRIGLQEDFGEALLPELLGQFSRAHPLVQISARIGRNSELLHGVRQGELDLALCWQGEETSRFMQPLPAAALSWIGLDATLLARWFGQGEALPLLLFDAPCLMRTRAIDALDHAAIPWRVAFTSRSLSGIWAAAAAGLGLTLRSDIGLPAGLQKLQHPLLPQVPDLAMALHLGQEILPPAAERLREILLTQLAPVLPQASVMIAD